MKKMYMDEIKKYAVNINQELHADEFELSDLQMWAKTIELLDDNFHIALENDNWDNWIDEKEYGELVCETKIWIRRDKEYLMEILNEAYENQEREIMKLQALAVNKNIENNVPYNSLLAGHSIIKKCKIKRGIYNEQK